MCFSFCHNLTSIVFYIIFCTKKVAYLIWQTTHSITYLIFHLFHKPKIFSVNLDLMHIIYISIRYLVNNYEVEENSSNKVPFFVSFSFCIILLLPMCTFLFEQRCVQMSFRHRSFHRYQLNPPRLLIPYEKLF